MRTLVLATANPGKIREIQAALRGQDLRVVAGPRLKPGWRVAETGRTLEANAVKKAGAWAKATGWPALADDTGLEVAALKGRPGVKSARFAGSRCRPADNILKLLRRLKGKTGSHRRAAFRCVMALAEPAGRVRTFEGRCPGVIAETPRGRGGFGYDPVFIPRGSGRSFAQMTLPQKQRLSHRGQALARLSNWLKRSWQSS